MHRLFCHAVPIISPEDRNAVGEHDFVRHALIDFDELADLPDKTREQFVEHLVISIWCTRCGVQAGKPHLTDKATRQDIFMSGVAHAMEQAGLPVKRWRKRYDNGGGESLYFRLARELAQVFGIDLPVDLKLAGKRAAQVQYGAMSPAMAAWQAAELAARRQRLSELVLRLKAARKIQGGLPGQKREEVNRPPMSG